MLVRFLKHSKGLGAGPLNYLLGSDRQRADTKMFYGDPVATKRREYTQEFNVESVSLVIEHNRKVAEANS